MDISHNSFFLGTCIALKLDIYYKGAADTYYKTWCISVRMCKREENVNDKEIMEDRTL